PHGTAPVHRSAAPPRPGSADRPGNTEPAESRPRPAGAEPRSTVPPGRRRPARPPAPERHGLRHRASGPPARSGTTVVGTASAGPFRGGPRGSSPLRTTAHPAGDAAGRPAGTARPSRGRRGTVSPNRAAPGTEPAGCTARARPGEPSPERGGEGGARGAGRAGRRAPPPVRTAARPAGTARPPRARGAGNGVRPSRDPPGAAPGRGTPRPAHRAAAPTAPPESRTTPYGQGVP